MSFTAAHSVIFGAIISADISTVQSLILRESLTFPNSLYSYFEAILGTVAVSSELLIILSIISPLLCMTGDSGVGWQAVVKHVNSKMVKISIASILTKPLELGALKMPTILSSKAFFPVEEDIPNA